MHVQKLVYIAHGWNLAVNNEPLIDESFVAWDYGPVVLTLFQALRRYGAGTVARLIRNGDDLPNDYGVGAEPVTTKLSLAENQVIDQIWNEFKNFKAFQLSELTNKSGSPWEKSYKKGMNVLIPNQKIQDYFSVLADAP